jgi:hypothetical protein
VLGGSGLLLSRGRLLLRLRYLSRIRRVDCGAYHDGGPAHRAAPNAENGVSVRHQLESWIERLRSRIEKLWRNVDEEHQDKGSGRYCRPGYRLHV